VSLIKKRKIKRRAKFQSRILITMITMHEENKKSFLDELQSLSEATKKKVVIIATAVLMIGVVYLWLGYFNGLVAGGSQQQQTAANGDAGNQAQIAQQNPSGTSGANGAGDANSNPGFAQNFKNGMAAIGQAFVGALKSPGKYNIQPQGSQPQSQPQ